MVCVMEYVGQFVCCGLLRFVDVEMWRCGDVEFDCCGVWYGLIGRFCDMMVMDCGV